MNENEKLDFLIQEVSGMKSDMQEMKADMQDAKIDIRDLKEDHLDLSRIFHEAMRPNNELEMLAIKVRVLETDVRNLKRICAVS